MTTVLFACTHNAGRSQMAAAFFNAAADPVKAHAISAGTQPATQVHPEVRDVMREIGFDLTAVPQLLTDELARGVQLLVTMGCGEACPYVPDLKRLDWNVPDPNRQPVEHVRAIRDHVRREVEALIDSRHWRRAGNAS